MKGVMRRLIPVVVGGIMAVFCCDSLGADANSSGFNYDDYAAVLKSYVDKEGMVNYRDLKKDRDKLDAFVDVMSKLNRKAFEKWDVNEKIAFWLNAYNALTLKVIIDNYPIKSKFFKSRVYPKNSIRQISGVWDKKKFNVMGRKVTLGHIEHKILRKQYSEPRIHMAMVCAAMSCPHLRKEPYLGNVLDKQLKNQSNRFVVSQRGFRIDEEKNVVYLSPILKWFVKDFAKTYKPSETRKRFSWLDKKQQAVLSFVRNHSGKTGLAYLDSDKQFKIKYLKYDWSLNEQKPKAKEGAKKK